MVWLKIDDVARETGLTKRTIRYYEEIGLLAPPQRSDGGTRLYTDDDVVSLKKIIHAREVLGFSLQELQDYIQIHDTLEQQRYGYRNSTTADEQRAKLIEIDATITDLLALIQQKMENIQAVQHELVDLQQRARSALEK